MLSSGIARVLVLGAGTIGTQVAAAFALRGFTTVLHDIDPARLERAMAEVRGLLDRLTSEGVIGRDTAAEARKRLAASADMAEAARGVDLVSESVPEDLALKREVFARLDAACGPETVFTTNTSDLLPSMLAEATGRPGLFAALHFHAPLHEGDIVDIMPHPGTAPETVAMLRRLADDLRLTAIVLEREHPGYVFNTLLNALNRAALGLVVEGVATPETVDMAWTRVMHAPIGPFGILDRVGLDTALRIARLGATHTGDPGLWKIVEYLAGYVEAGRLGVRSGQGFYSYTGAA